MGNIFGYDLNEAEELLNSEKEIVNIIYLDNVIVEWLKNGTIIPISFTLDGREYKISRVLSIQKGCSLKIYAPGFRYRCQVNSKYIFLYYNGEQWYIQSKIQ